MAIDELIRRLTEAPHDISFKEVMETIDLHYDYTPVAFSNGVGDERVVNAAGENEGSCKVFAFGRLNGFTETETLACFGEHYRHVLEAPDGTDHANIRTFMRFGWPGVELEGTALVPKA